MSPSLVFTSSVVEIETTMSFLQSTLSTEFTTPTSVIFESTSETLLSSLVPTSGINLTTTFVSSPMFSLATSSIEISPTMTFVTDITPMPSFTFISEVDISTISTLESSFTVTPMSTVETLSSSGATETASESLVSSSEFISSTIEIQSTISSSVEIVTMMTSDVIVESTSAVALPSFTLTSSFGVDTTATTIISSSEILPSITSVNLVETNSSVFTLSPSDTFNVTSLPITSTFSSLQSTVSTVETISSPIMIINSSSMTDFIISTAISEIASRTSFLPTQIDITSSEAIPSSFFASTQVQTSSSESSMSSLTIISSSEVVVPTTTLPEVSPTPTVFQCPSSEYFCEILMTCIPITQECPYVPKAPITVSVQGPGFLVNEIQQNENNTNQYTFKFGKFINAQRFGNEGQIVSYLGSQKASVNFKISSQISYSYLSGDIIQKRVAPNDNITVVVQAHHLSLFSTNGESITIIIIGNASDYSIQDKCTITSKSGYCISSLGGFTGASMIEISIMDENRPQNRISIGQVKVIEVVEYITTNNPAIVMKLPTHTIYPPENVTATISSIGYSVKSLLLDCSVNDSSVSIRASPIKNWSTLFINNNDNENQLAISHERVTEVNEFEDEEEILSIEINFKEYTSDRIEVKCQLVELLLSNGLLVNDVNISVLDRNNLNNSSGHMFIVDDRVEHLVAYSNQTELFNSAVLSGKTLMSDLVIKGITVTGEVVDLANLNCNSSNSNVLKVINCSAVILDGTETAGSESVAVNVYSESLHTQVLFRVWYPETLVLKAEDTVLNAISNWPGSNLSCDHKYQQTLFRVFANVSDGNTAINNLDVTSHISGSLMSSDESVLKVSNNTVQGVSVGTATIITNNNTVLIQFNVSNDPVRAEALEIILFNDLNMTISEPTDLYGDAYGTVTLTQENDRAKFLYVNVLFSDSQRMELKQSQFAVNNMCPDNIAIRGNLIHPIGNTNGSKECIEVTLVRDEACSINDSVKSTANISIQLSTRRRLEIKSSSTEIIADETISMVTGISTNITIQAILYFDEEHYIDVTLSDETNVITDLSYTRSPTSLIVTALSNNTENSYGLSITNSLYNMTNSTSVDVVHNTAINLSVHPFPLYNNSENVNKSYLSRISNTKKYQQAILKVVLILPNESTYDITDRATFTMQPADSILTISSGTDKIVTVNDNTMQNSSVIVTARFSSFQSNVAIQVRYQPVVELKSIDEIFFVPELRGVRNSTEFVDVSVTLDDDTILNNTYNEGDSLYPDLLNFTVSDTTSATTEGNNTVKLLGNSLTQNYIIAYAGNLSSNKSFVCNLEAGLHDVDLGNNLELPIDVDVNDEIKIPVHVNSENANLGIFELNVLYSSNYLQVDNVIPGDDWTTGSFDYQVTVDKDINMLNFGGINYNGKQGKSIHVADITFRANETGDVILNSSIALLAKSDLNSTLLGEVNRVSEAGSLLMVSIYQRPARRDIFYDEPPLMHPQTEIHHRYKRQSDEGSQQPLAGDVNSDGHIDLRDVNYLRHYQVESVYNFTSDNGQILVRSDVDILDINGDGQVNALDTTELESINLDLLKIISNVNATCYSDNGVCVCIITGNLYTADMQPSPTDDVIILVDFRSTNQSFQNEFNATYFERGMKVQPEKESGSYGGIVQAEFKNDSNKTTFVVKTNSSFNTPNVGISLVQVTVDSNRETSEERQSVHVKAGDTYPFLNVTVNIANISPNVNILLENGYSPFIELSQHCPVVSTTTTTTAISTMTTTSTSSLVIPSSTTDVVTTIVTVSASLSTAVSDTTMTTAISSTSSSSAFENRNTSTPSTPMLPTTSTEIRTTSTTATSSTRNTSTILPSTAATTSMIPMPTNVTSEINSTSSTSASTTATSSTSNTSTPSPSTAATTSIILIATSSVPTNLTSETTSTPTLPASTITVTSTSAITNTSTPSPSTIATTSIPSSPTNVISEISSMSTTSPSSVTTTTISAITTTVSLNITGDDDNSAAGGGGGGGGSGAIVAVVVVLVVAIAISVTVIIACWYRRNKKRKTYYFKPTSRPSSGLSSNYWFQEEEKIVSTFY